jgi:hypothetical protein
MVTSVCKQWPSFFQFWDATLILDQYVFQTVLLSVELRLTYNFIFTATEIWLHTGGLRLIIRSNGIQILMVIEMALHVNYDPYIVANYMKILILGKVPHVNVVLIRIVLQDCPCLQPFITMHVMVLWVLKLIVIVSRYNFHSRWHSSSKLLWFSAHQAMWGPHLHVENCRKPLDVMCVKAGIGRTPTGFIHDPVYFNVYLLMR